MLILCECSEYIVRGQVKILWRDIPIRDTWSWGTRYASSLRVCRVWQCVWLLPCHLFLVPNGARWVRAWIMMFMPLPVTGTGNCMQEHFSPQPAGPVRTASRNGEKAHPHRYRVYLMSAWLPSRSCCWYRHSGPWDSGKLRRYAQRFDVYPLKTGDNGLTDLSLWMHRSWNTRRRNAASCRKRRSWILHLWQRLSSQRWVHANIDIIYF